MTLGGSDKELAAALLERGLLKPAQLKKLQAKAKEEQRSFLEVVLAEEAVFPEALTQVRAELLGVPYVNLDEATVDETAMHDISQQAAQTYRFYAFGVRGNKLLVALEHTDDYRALEAVRFIAQKRGLRPQVYLASIDSITRRLGSLAEAQSEVGDAIRQFSEELEAADVAGKAEADIQHYIEEAPVTKVVAVIIRHAIEGEASDIHIEPSEKELRIRYRIDGQLHTSLLLPMRLHSAVLSRVKILSNLALDETRLPQDGRFSSTSEEGSFDFRVSTIPTIYGEKANLRILDKTEGAPSFAELGLRPKQENTYQRYLQSPQGIILVSGPSGAGKSTTLFSSLEYLNKPDVNIATLENPVEYDIPGVNQTQINPDIGLTYAAGMRSLVRQDPDVLMVGELDDPEALSLAVHAAMTGHLVLSSVHERDAVAVIPRLAAMGVDPFLLTATLRMVVAQRLVGRLCEHCRQETKIPERMHDQILDILSSVPDELRTTANQQDPTVLYTSTGCPVCHETGASGRLALFEVLPVTRRLREAMNEEIDYDTLYDIARDTGVLTMHQDGLLKALDGNVSYEDVVRVTSDSQAVSSNHESNG